MKCPQCGYYWKFEGAVKGGSAKTTAKRLAAQENGRKGGRPRKRKVRTPKTTPHQTHTPQET